MALYVYVIDPAKEPDPHYRRVGALVSWCPGDDDAVASDEDLATNGRAVVRGLPELDETHAWDEASHAVMVIEPPAEAKPIGTGTWLLRLSPDEFAGIDASTDRVVRHFMVALNHTTTIDLADPQIVQAVNYMVGAGLIDEDRVAQLLATE